MAAAYFRTPEIALEKEEARAIAEALAEVNRHYKIPGINPAHASIVSLLFVVTVTYGKRIPAIMSRGATANTTASAREERQAAQVSEPEPWFGNSSPPPPIQ